MIPNARILRAFSLWAARFRWLSSKKICVAHARQKNFCATPGTFFAIANIRMVPALKGS
ncbi:MULTISPECIES: hypothetical protein [unclassified Achromobacter]|uniref:hypothetical protein n=1 Tax=unclassified Achromobacter TaxID=2626865 RepID=UPI001304CF77|nr:MULTISPECIES: hypothetical protein [unclassified Achromobacter]